MRPHTHKAVRTYLLTGLDLPVVLQAPGSATQKRGQETSVAPEQKTLGRRNKVPKLPTISPLKKKKKNFLYTLFLFFKFLFYVCWCLPGCTSVYHTCTVPEARRIQSHRTRVVSCPVDAGNTSVPPEEQPELLTAAC